MSEEIVKYHNGKVYRDVSSIPKYIQTCWSSACIANVIIRNLILLIEYQNPFIVTNSILFNNYFDLFKLMDLATICIHVLVICYML